MQRHPEHKSSGAREVERKSRQVITTQELVALTDLNPPAPVARVWGPLPPRPYVAIVGTRRPTIAGAHAATEVARQLAERGATILSGGAVGIDTAAHEGALAAGGRTMVVAPVWFEHAHPRSNRSLFSRILEQGGCYLTTADEDAVAHFHTFFRRNAVMMALADVVILGDCGFRSGARNAMKAARQLGRPRYCLPWTFDESRTWGPAREIELGARPLFHVARLLRDLRALPVPDNPLWLDALSRVTSPEQVGEAELSERPTSRRGASPAKEGPRETHVKSPPTDPPLTAEARILVGALEAGAGTVELLVESTRLPVQVVQHQLTLLTLQGYVVEDARGILRYTPYAHD